MSNSHDRPRFRGQSHRTRHVTLIFGIGVLTAALWVPLQVFLAQPDRQLLGERAHLAAVLSAIIQAGSLIIGIVVLAADTREPDRARRRSTLWGLLALPPAVIVAWIVATLTTSVSADDPQYLARGLVFLAALTLLSIPTAIPAKHERVLALSSLLVTSLALGASAVVMIGSLSFIVIGPATAYCVAVTLKSANAAHAELGSMRMHPVDHRSSESQKATQ